MAAIGMEAKPHQRAEHKTFLYYRHSVLVRTTHWINVVCVALLLMSGMAIFNAHPALYLGAQSDFGNPLLNFGMSHAGVNSVVASRPFPEWLTGGLELPNGRRWHLFIVWVFVANGAVYLIASLLDRHIWRDLVPRTWQLREIGTTVRHHLRLYFPHTGEYNVLQKTVYLGMIFIVFPAIILTGLSMSPGVDSFAPWLGNALGGRQTARTIHFICASLIVIFIVVHVGLVLLAGFRNELRSMITGEYEIEPEEEGDAAP